MNTSQPTLSIRVHVGLSSYYQLTEQQPTVLLYIMIAHEMYGPYLTGIATTPAIWQAKRMTNTTPEGKALQIRIQDLSTKLLDAWSDLIKREEVNDKGSITGEMVLQQAGLAGTGLPGAWTIDPTNPQLIITGLQRVREGATHE